jgi:hypothetical protein
MVITIGDHVGVLFTWSLPTSKYGNSCKYIQKRSVHISKYGKNGNKIAEEIGMVLTVDLVVYSGQGAFPNMDSVAMQNEK